MEFAKLPWNHDHYRDYYIDKTKQKKSQTTEKMEMIWLNKKNIQKNMPIIGCNKKAMNEDLPKFFTLQDQPKLN